MHLFAIRDQEQPIGNLRRAIASGKVPHAYLFSGPAGVGKGMAARALAAALNCEARGDDACGRCGSCVKAARMTHPDIRVLGPPEGKRRIPIESVREAERWLAVRAHEGRAKVLVIEPADEMTEPAANALLKTLEEPRAGSYLVLVTAAPTALLATVVSRCQVVRFGPLSRKTVEALLVEQGADGGAAELIAALACGSMERAREYRDERLERRLEMVSVLLSSAVAATPKEAMATVAELKGDRDETRAVLELALVVLQELVWLSSFDQPALAAASSPLARRIGPGAVELLEAASVERLTAEVAAANRALVAISRNNMNPQLALEGMVAAGRGHRIMGEQWSRIGAR